MIIKIKTRGIRLCDCSFLGKVHNNILKDFKFKSEEENIGYTLDIFFDDESNIGFAIVEYKIFFKDYTAKKIKEKIINLDKETFTSIQKEYKPFIIEK